MLFRSSMLLAALALVGACGSQKPLTPVPIDEICDNQIDDNGDGKVDCLDPTCFTNARCQVRMERCDNGADDNGDGLIDCADPQCEGQLCAFNSYCGGSVCNRGGDGGMTGTGGGTGNVRPDAGTGGGNGQTGGGTGTTGGGSATVGGGTGTTGGGSATVGGGTGTTGGGSATVGGGTGTTGGGSATTGGGTGTTGGGSATTGGGTGTVGGGVGTTGGGTGTVGGGVGTTGGGTGTTGGGTATGGGTGTTDGGVATWTCPATWLGDGECDCGCGIVDTDCAGPQLGYCQWCGNTSNGCARGNCRMINATNNATCNATAATWSCDSSWYNEAATDDFCFWFGGCCDCGCGILDPDCDDNSAGVCDFNACSGSQRPGTHYNSACVP